MAKVLVIPHPDLATGRLPELVDALQPVHAFAAAILVRDTRGGDNGRVDVPGTLLLALGVLALVVPLIEGRERGWPWRSLAMLALSPCLLAVFWRLEQRRERLGRSPLVPPSVTRRGAPHIAPRHS